MAASVTAARGSARATSSLQRGAAPRRAPLPSESPGFCRCTEQSWRQKHESIREPEWIFSTLNLRVQLPVSAVNAPAWFWELGAPEPSPTAGSSPVWGTIKINPKPCPFAAQDPELVSLGGTPWWHFAVGKLRCSRSTGCHEQSRRECFCAYLILFKNTIKNEPLLPGCLANP